MPTIQDLPRIYSTYINSDYCPSFSTVVKTVAVIAGAVLGWRYAPKFTLTCLTGTALYSGVWRSSPPPSVTIMPPKVESIDELPEITPVEPTDAPIPVPSEFTTLQDVNLWIEDYVKNPSAPKELLPVLTFLCHCSPKDFNILDWKPPIPGSKHFAKALQERPDYLEPLQKYVMSKHPEAAALAFQQVETMFGKQALSAEETAQKEAFFASINSGAQDENLSDVCLSVIKEVKKGLDPAFKAEVEYMTTVLFLSAALHKTPSLIASVASKLQPLEQSEEAFKNKSLRIFILRVLSLSKYTQFDDVLKNINPEKFENSKKTIFNKPHPLNQIELGDHSYGHFLACTQWYKATKEKQYVGLIQHLYTQATTPLRLSNFIDYLNLMDGETNFNLSLLKNFITLEIKASNCLNIEDGTQLHDFFS